ncbi:MAG: nitroreductase family protein [Chloroflexi bacterium]|nr:nitroreductase family protein [Chloroflexota bacterium]MCH7656128.1 nitroreductase family protein [Chloroflexota bacterium]
MADEIGLFEAIYTQRALRHLKPDPVPDELIRKVIDAGIHAPNGGNQQRWAFVVIKDPVLKAKLAEPYKAEGHPDHGEAGTWSKRNAEASADYLADHAAEVPVWILACTEHPGTDISHGASIYPAVQNMLLAARALGLGSVMTTRVRRGFEPQMREWVGIPDGFVTAAMIPLGYPQDGYRYGPTTRRDAAEVTHWEHWGNH